jgi:Secretion system C-terminal sorting domain
MKKCFLLLGLFVIGPITYSQSTLTIQTTVGLVGLGFETGYNIDSVFGEISGCGGFDNRIYIFVIDTPSIVSGGCAPWETNYNGFNPNHEFGNIMGCRPRPEAYFQYDQSDPSSMQSLDSLINYHIPDGYVFGMYSWINYDYSTINTVCPALGNTLFNYWGSNATASHMAAIFFAVKGQPLSYDMVYTDNPSDTIQMVKQICLPMQPNGINIESQSEVIVYPNPFNSYISVTGIDAKTGVKLYNTLGEILGNYTITETNNAINTENLSSGVYFLNIGTTTKKIIKQ